MVTAAVENPVSASVLPPMKATHWLCFKGMNYYYHSSEDGEVFLHRCGQWQKVTNLPTGVKKLDQPRYM